MTPAPRAPEGPRRPAPRAAAAAAALLALAALGGCTSLQVVTDHDRTVDFGPYRTFALREGTPARKGPIDDLLRAALTRALEQRGLRLDPEHPDLLIIPHVAIGRQVTIDNTEYGVVQWNVWGYWVEPGRTQPDLVSTGTVAVDVVDARTKKLLWRGKATDDPEAYAGSRGETLFRKLAERLFADFPPPPPKKA